MLLHVCIESLFAFVVCRYMFVHTKECNVIGLYFVCMCVCLCVHTNVCVSVCMQRVAMLSLDLVCAADSFLVQTDRQGKRYSDVTVMNLTEQQQQRYDRQTNRQTDRFTYARCFYRAYVALSLSVCFFA